MNLLDDAIKGYAVLYNELSRRRRPRPGEHVFEDQRDVFRSGAFRDASMTGITCWLDHGAADGDPYGPTYLDRGKLLGSVAEGNLDVWEDDQGVGFRIQLPDTAAGRRLLEACHTQRVQGASPGFRVQSVWHEWYGLEIKRATLTEISVMVAACPLWPVTIETLRLVPVARAAVPSAAPAPDLTDWAGAIPPLPSWVPYAFRSIARQVWLDPATGRFTDKPPEESQLRAVAYSSSHGPWA